MNLAALFSGGKDSSLAVQRVLEKGWHVTRLVSVTPKTPESYMFHYPNISMTELQAEAAGIPLVKMLSEGVKEEEVKDIEKALRPLKGEVSGVVVGALASKYQSDRVEAVCRKLGLDMVAPLWGEDPLEIWNELLEKGFRIMVVGVACEGLGREWLGRIIDHEALEELSSVSERFRFHLAGEGGEFETLTLDAPFFRKSIVVREARTEWHGDSGHCLITRAELAEKQ